MNDEYLAHYLKCWYKVFLSNNSEKSKIQAGAIAEVMNHLGIKYEVNVK